MTTVWNQAAALWRRKGPESKAPTILRMSSEPSDEGPDELTLCLLLNEPPADPAGELFSIGGDGDGAPCISAVMDRSQRDVRVEVRTDFSQTPLRLEVDATDLFGSEPHSAERDRLLVLRYSPVKVELFLNGGLVDQEWPIGRLVWNRSRVLRLGVAQELADSVRSIAVWTRCLTDSQVQELGGSPSGGPRRHPTSLTELQYGEPPGYRTLAADCMPYWDGELFHLFYLIDRKQHKSKWGLGAHEWGHLSTADLREWTIHPKALSITDQEEGSICTGSVFRHGGKTLAFYATRSAQRLQELCLASSDDGIVFSKSAANPISAPEPPYRIGPFRDPFVFEHEGQYHMIVTAELAEAPTPHRGGCLAHLVSTDCLSWRQEAPFLVPGYPDHQPECPDLFEWNGWYYLLFSHHGVAHYRMARSPLGPWVRAEVDTLDGPQARVMKTAPFGARRRMGAAFVTPQPGGGGFGGSFLFREIVQRSDGTLGTRFVPEMVPAETKSVAAEVTPLNGDVAGSARRLTLSATGGYAAASVAKVTGNARIRMSVAHTGAGCAFGLGIDDGSEESSGAFEICFEPARGKVGWRTLTHRSWQENESAAIYGVDSLATGYEVDLILAGTLLDLSISGDRTLVNRCDRGLSGALYLYSQDGEVVIQDLRIALFDP
jgi:hypothetical protein